MKDGIYFVKFKSNIQDFGDGTVVVKNGVVNGGDYGFTYQGRIDDNCLKLSAKQHDKNVVSVFGNITDYEVVLDINSLGNDYELVGKTDLAPEVIIQVQAKFIGELLI
ncbi:negative regulator GrlR [Acinetobacter baumannii]|uniref:GrlR family regulatory protein n=1 Tax=Acinetobacter baumannii TaxID=470 RepID=UPI0021BD356A|nr:negative regulator GrlR [Acinetobacter baumannii]EKT8702790.1 negative regulator GrlR [Acinetobacter baumannii]EKV2134209.1 negative regulator GrlR [Acinetobacter baumannii]MCT9186743.1 negative regulator GrlR [Acinetobacter baumannii]MCT9290836.1 negative regulator GrlR [Acinetobacter baumannii]